MKKSEEKDKKENIQMSGTTSFHAQEDPHVDPDPDPKSAQTDLLTGRPFDLLT